MAEFNAENQGNLISGPREQISRFIDSLIAFGELIIVELSIVGCQPGASQLFVPLKACSFRPGNLHLTTASHDLICLCGIEDVGTNGC